MPRRVRWTVPSSGLGLELRSHVQIYAMLFRGPPEVALSHQRRETD